jgi:RimJ/RimL family protein N-acetyltransferase
MAFELQPVLEGRLVRLRPLRHDDWDALFAAASDPLIWELHPDSDRYKEDVFRRYFDGAIDSRGAFAVLDAKTDAVIGSSRYHGYDEATSEVEIGWTFLARSHWGGAANAEMKDLMLRHAFRFVRNVIFRVGPQNWRSQRAVEKIGGRRIGTALDDTGRESVVFRITAEEFRSRGGESV